MGIRTTYSMDGRATAGLMQCDGSPGFGGRHGSSQDDRTAMVRAGTNRFKANLREHGDKWDRRHHLQGPPLVQLGPLRPRKP